MLIYLFQLLHPMQLQVGGRRSRTSTHASGTTEVGCAVLVETHRHRNDNTRPYADAARRRTAGADCFQKETVGAALRRSSTETGRRLPRPQASFEG
jgi:hypothetical protein